MSEDDLSPAIVWALPLEEAVQRIVANANRFDERRSVMWSAFLQARVMTESAAATAETTRGLVQATHDLGNQTRYLAWATVALAAITAASVIFR